MLHHRKHHRISLNMDFAGGFWWKTLFISKDISSCFFFVTFACVESVCVVANIVRRIMCFSHRSCCISLCEAFYIFVGNILLYKMSFYVACFHISIYLIQIHIPLAQKKTETFFCCRVKRSAQTENMYLCMKE